jgi:hypothetical protein
MKFQVLARWLRFAAAGCFLISGTKRAADLALRFDGTNDYVTFGPTNALGTTNFTNGLPWSALANHQQRHRHMGGDEPGADDAFFSG